MKRDNLKLGEERKKQQENGRLGGKRYFLLYVETSVVWKSHSHMILHCVLPYLLCPAPLPLFFVTS